VLTADCGTSDHPALNCSRSRGVDVVVIDHHQVPTGLSPAYALINPHRADDRFSFKGLASCGVAFYLAAALRSRLRARNHPPAQDFDPRQLLDLVALGTLADLVPLQEENRILVTAGLRELGARRRPGLRVLAEIAELDPGAPIGAHAVCFRLTPRLNAPGRLGQAQRALDLLLSENDDEARRQAAEIDEVNRERQRIQEEVWQAACREAESQAGAAAIVVGAEGWHPGVVGIVAAKLVERFRCPAVVIGFRDGVGRGSARTVGRFNLHTALAACSPHLEVFGGHAAAAGMTLQLGRLAAFREAFLAQAQAHAGTHPNEPEPLVDGTADLRELDLAQAEEFERLAPFGSANQEPVLAIPAAVVRASRKVGQGHLQVTLSQGPSAVDAIGFNMAADAPPDGSVVDVLATPEVDAFRGFRRARLRLRQIFRSG
jgi:single-stranded-DNA-specific exonuclease